MLTDGICNSCISRKGTGTYTSKDIRAISSANFECYQYHLTNGHNIDTIQYYREKLIRFEITLPIKKKMNTQHEVKQKLVKR